MSAVRRAPLALLVVALAGCEPAPEPVALPRLVVDAPAFDFGQLPQGAPIEHGFDVRNDGGAPLTIIDLRTASDCTATLDGPRDLPAGARATLRLRCATDTTPGPQRRTVTVYSNDPEHRAMVLVVTGTVALEAAAARRVYLGPVPAGSEGRAHRRCAPAMTASASSAPRAVRRNSGRASPTSRMDPR